MRVCRGSRCAGKFRRETQGRRRSGGWRAATWRSETRPGRKDPLRNGRVNNRRGRGRGKNRSRRGRPCLAFVELCQETNVIRIRGMRVEGAVEKRRRREGEEDDKRGRQSRSYSQPGGTFSGPDGAPIAHLSQFTLRRLAVSSRPFLIAAGATGGLAMLAFVASLACAPRRGRKRSRRAARRRKGGGSLVSKERGSGASAGRRPRRTAWPARA